MPAVDVLVAAQAELGEGPIWDPWLDALLWVDINAGQVHRTSASGDDGIVFASEQSVGFVAPVGAQQHIIGQRTNLIRTTDWVAEDTLCELDGLRPSQRINDGKRAPEGRVVFGTLDEDGDPGDNCLYSWDADDGVRAVVNDIRLSNGVAWSPDGAHLYYIDTPTRRLDRFDYNADTGAVSNRTVCRTFDDVDGLPDGMTSDAEGCLWVAFWGGSAVRRVTPAGDVDRTVAVPATNPTSCTFGPDGTLYITSARIDTEHSPHDGNVFVVGGLATS